MSQAQNRPAITPEQIERIRTMAEGLQYGTLSLVFQDGVLVQIERHEKIRIGPSNHKEEN